MSNDPRITALTDVIQAIRPDWPSTYARNYVRNYVAYNNTHTHTHAYAHAHAYAHTFARTNGFSPLTPEQQVQVDAARALLFG